MEHIHELLGYERIKIIQKDEMFSFSLDSMLLADFVKVNEKTKRIVDLGCGNAPIPLFLTLKTDAKIYGIELQEEVYEMAKKSVSLNGFDRQITILNADIKNIYKTIGNDSFDIVISNPPFFKYQETSNINKNEYLTIARHEVKITLEEIIKEAKKLLKDGASLYMVHRTSRLSELLFLLRSENMGLKKIRFIYTKKDSSESLMFLLEAKKNRKDDVKVEAPLYVYDGSEYTSEVLKIFNFKKE